MHLDLNLAEVFTDGGRGLWRDVLDICGAMYRHTNKGSAGNTKLTRGKLGDLGRHAFWQGGDTAGRGIYVHDFVFHLRWHSGDGDGDYEMSVNAWTTEKEKKERTRQFCRYTKR